MFAAFNSTNVGVILASFLVAVIVQMMRSRKPDPKMELLTSLLKDLPGNGSGANPAGGSGADSDPKSEHGPLGPSGFSHVAAGAEVGLLPARPNWAVPGAFPKVSAGNEVNRVQ